MHPGKASGLPVLLISDRDALIIGKRYMRMTVVQRLLSSFVLSSFLLGSILPCFAMEPAGNHAHAVGLPSPSEHAHEETEGFPSDSSPSHDHDQRPCCHDNLRAAFYGAASNGKSLATNNTFDKVPIQLFLSFFTCPPIVDFSARHGFKTLPLALRIPTPSLYRLNTSLLL